MNLAFRREMLSLALALAAGVAAGYAFGGVRAGMVVAGVGWVAILLWRLRRLLGYVAPGGAPGRPPPLGGICGTIAQRIYAAQTASNAENARLGRQLSRNMGLIEGVRDGVLLLDSRDRILWHNSRAGLLAGLRDDDSGLAITNFLRAPQFVGYLARGRFATPLQMESPTLGGHWLEVSITSYRDGMRLLLLRDITRLKHLEQMRSDFVANLSHEMRTPLAVLRGDLENLGQVPQARRKELLASMDGQVARMTRLMDSLLRLSHLEGRGDKQPMPVAMAPVVRRAAAGHKKGRIKLDLDEELRILGDEAALESVATNLLDNACKYSDDPVSVRLWRDDDGAHLQVKDSGIGIAMEHLPRLTERFYRVDNSARRPGTGLGLAIVKHALLRCGGRLRVQSRPGAGSTFVCHFAPASIAAPGNCCKAVT